MRLFLTHCIECWEYHLRKTCNDIREPCERETHFEATDSEQALSFPPLEFSTCCLLPRSASFSPHLTLLFFVPCSHSLIPGLSICWWLRHNRCYCRFCTLFAHVNCMLWLGGANYQIIPYSTGDLYLRYDVFSLHRFHERRFVISVHNPVKWVFHFHCF